MKEEIIARLNNAHALEQLYRKDKQSFKQNFTEVYPQINDNLIADFWFERLNYQTNYLKKFNKNELIFVAIASLLAALIAKIPVIFNLNEELFFSRNIGFIFLPILTMYFSWKNKLPLRKTILFITIILLSVAFINLLPKAAKSDTLVLSCFHLPLFLWSVLGFSFANDKQKRLSFLKYNGDLLVIIALILITGAIMTAITLALFSLTDLKIEEFYFKNIVISGFSAAPIIGTYLIQTNTQLVDKISPLIARLFSPLVAIMLFIYLIVIIYSGKNPYNDREFLIIFNILLIGVMAIIFFAIAEQSSKPKNQGQIWVLFVLSCLTIIINSIALSAILSRIVEWGFTPNRTAVLTANMLILVNLVLVTFQLLKVIFKRTITQSVENTIASFLPFYFGFTILVSFIFPLIFDFK